MTRAAAQRAIAYAALVVGAAAVLTLGGRRAASDVERAEAVVPRDVGSDFPEGDRPGGRPPASEAPVETAPSAGAGAPVDADVPDADVPVDAAVPVDARPLGERHLVIPVERVRADDLAPGFDLQRGEARHEAVDIMAPTGTPVVAVDDGRIEKLFTSKPGGLTIYQFDPEREHAYYYAHLDRYAESLEEGQRVLRGQRIGYVGTTGNAPKNAPHLHFAIFRLGAEKRWWKGTALDPYPLLRRGETLGR